MANFDGYTAHAIERISSMVDQDEPTNIPLGVSPLALNHQFRLTRGGTRFGINKRVGNAWTGLDLSTAVSGGAPVTGANDFKYEGNGVQPDIRVPVVLDANGNLLREDPPGSGFLKKITSSQVTPGASNYLQADQTLNRAYMAFTNIAAPSAAGSSLGVLDLLTSVLDPLSMRPVGETWQKNTTYALGECVSPIATAGGGNGLAPGKLFRCTTAGKSGAVEPTWDPADGSTTGDGVAVWTENTPLFTSVIPQPNGIIQAGTGALFSSPNLPNSGFVLTCSVNAGAGTFAASRDVYIAVSLLNANGETDVLTGLAIVNTVLNDQLKVKVTTILRTWIIALQFPATGWNLYVADVATGVAAPALTAYGKVAGGPFGLALNTEVLAGVSPAASGTVANAVSADLGDIANDIVPTIGAGAIVRVGSNVFVESGGELIPATNVNTTLPTGVPLSNAAFLVQAAGNIDGGIRFAIVLFVNRNEYISGYGINSAVESNLIGGNLFIQMFNIPTGPENTTARIIAFCQAGGTSAGPFAYIPDSDSVNGIRIFSTIIPDNTTTGRTFNFTDTFLEQLMATTANVTSNSDKIQVPPCRNIYFSQSLNRMFYLAYELPSGAWVAPPRDPETIFGSTGDLEVSETDGQTLWGVIDFDGTTWGLKSESGHEIISSSADPAQWTTVRRWGGDHDACGPCGPRAFSAGLWFFGFVHRSGVYVNHGGKPERITKEIPKLWKRVNWAAATTIWMKIDDDTHQIYIGVPLDGSPLPSHILVCNFEEDRNLGAPIRPSLYSRGKFIAHSDARKWSLWPIPANSAVRFDRTLLNTPAGMDSTLKTTQLCFASSVNGNINAMTPDIYSDNGAGIDWIYETACPGDALKDTRLGGAQAMMIGNGKISVTALADLAKSTQGGGVNLIHTEIPMKPAYLKPGISTDYAANQEGRNERWRLRFSHVGQPAGTWCDLKSATLYLNPVFTAGPN